MTELSVYCLGRERCLCNMRGLQIRGRPGTAQLVIMVFAGVCMGLFVGFGFMSTVETVSSPVYPDVLFWVHA